MEIYENIVKLWQSFNVSTESDIDLRLENFRILFAYNSGKIENDAVTYHDTREIFENGRVTGYTGAPRAIFEQENQRMCYEFIKPKLIEREPLSISIIREVHAVLTSGTYDERRYVSQGERPGEFKRHDYVVGRTEVGSPPEDVEKDLQALIEELNTFDSNNQNDILTAAAYFHARFEYIHPFADGNGRVGRTLLNYFLMLQNHPPLIIYDENKGDYYAALESYDTTEEIAHLRIFLLSQTEKTWRKTLERNNFV